MAVNTMPTKSNTKGGGAIDLFERFAFKAIPLADCSNGEGKGACCSYLLYLCTFSISRCNVI